MLVYSTLTRIQGDFEGHTVELWAALFTGLEIVSVDGREVSRKRTFGCSTTHRISVDDFAADTARVKELPVFKLVLLRNGEVLATFKNRFRLLGWVVLGVVLGLLMGVLSETVPG